jgi:hypothetical protein
METGRHEVNIQRFLCPHCLLCHTELMRTAKPAACIVIDGFVASKHPGTGHFTTTPPPRQYGEPPANAVFLNVKHLLEMVTGGQGSWSGETP